MMTGEDCSVVVINLDCTNLHNYLVKRQLLAPYALLSLPSSLDLNAPSRLGTHFALNVNELLDLAQTYFYPAEVAVELRAAATHFNLALTSFYAEHTFLLTFKDFLATIGRVRLRENLRYKNLIVGAMSNSLLNIAES